MNVLRTVNILKIANEFLIDSPAPVNLNYMYNFGSLLGLNLVLMIITGLSLAMHYVHHIDLAFNSVEHIMRDVSSGYLLRYFHSNGASFFFILVYLHIARGLFYGSYRNPRGMLWNIGVVIYILMMATGFLGYVLPWGQFDLLYQNPLRLLDLHSAVTIKEIVRIFKNI